MRADAPTINEFLDHKRRHEHTSPNTLYAYSSHLRSLASHLNGRPLADATRDDVLSWLARPRRGGKPPSPATRKNELSTVRSLFHWLHEYRGIASNPLLGVKNPQVRNDTPKPVPEAVWVRLWASDLSAADRAAFGLAFFAGLRRSEVTGLAPWQVDSTGPYLTLRDVLRKGGGRRDVPVGSVVRMFERRRPDLAGDAALFLTAVEKLADRQDDETLIDWPIYAGSARAVNAPPHLRLDPIRFNRRLAAALVAAGLPADSCTPHQLRHAFCTYLLRMGFDVVEVARMAGHADVKVTMRYLQTHTDPAAARLAEEAAVTRW